MRLKRFTATVTFLSLCAFWSLPARADGLTEAEKESRWGNLLDLYVAETFVILKDGPATERVTLIATRVLRGAGNLDPKFKARIINDSLPLVLSFPGFVYVSSGLLDVLESEEELAAVLAPQIAAVIEGRQYNAFTEEWGKRKRRRTGQSILILGVGVGGAVAAGLAGAASGLAVGISPAASVLPAAVATSLTQAFKEEVKLPERKVLLNRMGPAAYPLIHNNLAEEASATILFNELYGGYEDDMAFKSIDFAVRYLKAEGYNPVALIAVYEKLLRLRDTYLSRGYTSALLFAKPGLEEKIEYAKKCIENNQ